MGLFTLLFDTSDFPPRWHCGAWTDLHGWVHIGSDVLIAVSYFAIPVTILRLVWKRSDVPFRRVFWLFASFILLCGLGHLVEASIFWHPWYRFSGLVKAATAVVSLATAVASVPVMRKAIKLPAMARLNAELQHGLAERDTMEDALRQSERRVQSIIESAVNPIVTFDEQGTITGWNPEATQVFGWSQGEALGRVFVDLIFPADFREAYRSGLRQLVEQGESWIANHHLELTAVRKDGQALPIELAITALKSPCGMEFGAFMRDLSVFQRQDERFRLVVESAPNAMIMVNMTGSIVLANAQAERLFGRTREELLLLRIDELVPERFRTHYEHMALAKVRSMGVGLDLSVLNHDGAEVPVEIGLTPISTPDGEFVLASIIDVSARKRAEDAIRASLHEKEVLLKEVHHRVKNNLQIVSSLLNLQANQVSHPEALEALSESRNRIRTMALVHETLYQADTIGQLDLAEYTKVLANELLSLYAGHSGAVRLEFALTPMQVTIETAIPCALIINELISNTFKYAFPAGRRGIARLELTRDGQTIHFSVRDNGIGFPDSSAAATGTASLGLQLVRDLARQLGGTFQIDSQPGNTHCRLSFSADRAPVFEES